MRTYTYELIPVKGNRETVDRERITRTCQARNYGTATQIASAEAAKVSKERRMEFGVARVY